MSGLGLYILRDKIPVTVDSAIEWGEWFSHFDRRRVAEAIWREGDEVVARISTVFLGTDHSTPWQPRTPILFETMAFGGPLDEEQDRYRTWDEAIQGHRYMVGVTEAVLGAANESMETP